MLASICSGYGMFGVHSAWRQYRYSIDVIPSQHHAEIVVRWYIEVTCKLIRSFGIYVTYSSQIYARYGLVSQNLRMTLGDTAAANQAN